MYSPTFALAHHYLTPEISLVHLDLYRLDDYESADELFIQEEEEAQALGAFMAIEWPEKLSINLPEAWILEMLYTKDNQRIAQLSLPRKASTES